MDSSIMRRSYVHKKLESSDAFFVLNVRQQILMAFLLITLVPIVIISAVSIIHERKRLLDAYESLISDESIRISSTLFDITLSMYTSCEPLLSQDSYRQLFAVDSCDRNSSDTYDILENILATMNTTDASVSDIAIYTNNPNIPAGNYIHSCAEDYAGMEWYENLMSAPNNISHWDYTCTTTEHPVQTLNEATLTRRFALPSTQYSAYVVITINYEGVYHNML